MRPHFRLEVLIPSFSFRRSLRSCDMDFLYHEWRRGLPRLPRAQRETRLAASLPVIFKPPPEAPTAGRRSYGTPASAPRRPPSHPPGNPLETPPPEPPAP